MQARLGEILAAAPKDWYGTTYPNDYRYRGRKEFMSEMLSLLRGTQPITTEHLGDFFPEDYVRLGSPFSTLLEVVTAVQRGYSALSTFVFASRTLPLVAVLLAARDAPAFVYYDDISSEQQPLLTPEQEDLLQSLYGCRFTACRGEPQDHGDAAVVIFVSDRPWGDLPHSAIDHLGDTFIDAIVSTDGFVFIFNTDMVPPEDIKGADGTLAREGVHTMRKRLGAATPTPEAIQRLNGESLDDVPDTAALCAHLKEMAGLAPDAPGDTLLSTVGLAALAAVVMASLEVGHHDIDSVMCSTAYGGSSQQTDILSTRSKSDTVSMFRHKFDIQGASADVLASVTETLAHMKTGPRKSLTLVQIEYPTNPDMKDCDLGGLREVLDDYRRTTGSQVLLLLDTTFSPPSRAAEQVAASGADDPLPVLVFNSLSKSVTGGFTTGGSVVANAAPLAQEVLRRAHAHLALLDNGPKACQLKIFNDMHGATEQRVCDAHDNCVATAAAFERAVERFSGQPMHTNFVTPAQIRKGVTPATFSFNLPAPPNADAPTREAFAQRFVDSLANSEFGRAGGIKPCVSFGQKNTTVYATVPATSTQGVISKELTAKQALGGVQLIRFSFPTSMDHAGWGAAVDQALKEAYSPAHAAGAGKNDPGAAGEANSRSDGSAATAAAQGVPARTAAPGTAPQPAVSVPLAVGVVVVAAVVAALLYRRTRGPK